MRPACRLGVRALRDACRFSMCAWVIRRSVRAFGRQVVARPDAECTAKLRRSCTRGRCLAGCRVRLRPHAITRWLSSGPLADCWKYSLDPDGEIMGLRPRRCWSRAAFHPGVDRTEPGHTMLRNFLRARSRVPLRKERHVQNASEPCPVPSSTARSSRRNAVGWRRLMSGELTRADRAR